MPISDEFVEYVFDELSGLGEISMCRMFGRVGIYYQEMMFAKAATVILFGVISSGLAK
jgi:TfoX/Sxy family transcriptional regulator of competence genes